ncbi:MAG: tRNA lysidine(34) synthetase TilS [Gammaproteobacteria bacterium]|nr:tRNA lysidine(34) synthetase TilS [Gammaproteobacteria bacterium]
MSGPSRAAERFRARSRSGVGDDLPQRLARRLQALLPAGAHPAWLVAFSGGADSLALLAALRDLQRAKPAGRRAVLRAVHVDHGLNPRSRAWARHCRQLCRELGVPLTVRRARIVVPRGASLEAVARTARYALLRATLRPGELLLTAHHLDDQLETLLLQLLRGAGVAGLAAMPEAAPFGRGWLLRPLLGTTRDALVEWVRARGLGWVEDDSNADERFDRNYLRRQVVPVLKARWSAAAQVVARSAAHLAEARGVLEEVAAADLAGLARGRALDIAALQRLSSARRRLAVRAWIQQQGLPLPDTRHLERVLGELTAARRDAQPCVRWQGAEVRRHRGRLYLLAVDPVVPVSGSLPRAAELHWDWRGGAARGRGPQQGRARGPERTHARGLGRERERGQGRGRGRERVGEDGSGPTSGGVLPLGAGLGSLVLRRDPRGALDGDRLPERLVVRWRDGGERLRTERDGPQRRLKEVLRVRGVLPWMRGRLPLLYAGDVLVAVADLAVAAAFQAGANCRNRWRLEWRDAPVRVAVPDPATPAAQPAGTSARPDRQ